MKVKNFLTKEKWTKGQLARNQQGEDVAHDDPSACCFCLEGAMIHCYGMPAYREVNDRVKKEIGMMVFEWNDDPNRTFEEIKTLVEEMDI